MAQWWFSPCSKGFFSAYFGFSPSTKTNILNFISTRIEDPQEKTAKTDVDSSPKYCDLLLWQSKSERSDWFLLGQDFAIRTVPMETVLGCVFFVFESQQIQNKHGPSAIQ